MEKLKINTIRNNQFIDKKDYAGADFIGKIPKYIEHIGPLKVYDGISTFTEECFDSNSLSTVDLVASNIKVAWLHEPRGLSEQMQLRYNNLESIIDKFDYVMTYDEHLLLQYPTKAIFTPGGHIWIENESAKIHPKSKHTSMIYSWKKWTEGHALRHKVAELMDGVELFGTGAGREVLKKEEGLVDFKYSIIIENCKTKNWYTEKLLDCLITGTVPIYWGCPNIGDYFNEKGILQFNKIEDLDNIFNLIADPNHYNQMMPYIIENFNSAVEYAIYEDWLYNNVYTKMLSK